MMPPDDERPGLPPPRRSLGQVFLASGRVIHRIVAALGHGPDDVVVEIGPGRGALPELIGGSADLTPSNQTAIKDGDVLSQEEMNHLIDMLFATQNPYICPHGRPTFIRLPLAELDRKFKR